MRSPLPAIARACLALGFAILTPASLAAVGFAPAVAYPVADQPVHVAMGDLNGDGKQDLVSCNAGDNSITMLLGIGDGTFAAGVRYAVGALPVEIALGDFDGDGDVDMAVVNRDSDSVSVLLNDGSAFFSPAAGSPVAIGDLPFGIATGDFNADGRLDFAVVSSGSNSVSIVLGDGTGGFAPAPGSPFAVGTNPLDVAVGHLDADAHLDLVVTNRDSDNLTVLKGDGTGAFTAAGTYAAGNEPAIVALADLDGDGNLDLIASNISSSDLSIRLGDGSGGFGPASAYAVGSAPWTFAAGDVDLDGRPDLVVANNASSSVMIALGNGDGTFQAPVTVAISGARGVSIGDFNGNGLPDVAVGGQFTDSVNILLALPQLPGAPTIGTATGGNAQVSVTFTAPAFDGGSAIIDYTATCGTQSATGTASPVTVAGLTNGTAYTCTVVARNGVGTGPASAASNSVTPLSAPDAPTGATATAGNAQVSVTFTAPPFDGGSPILDYTATCGSQSATGPASPITVSGLVNGTPYTCTVVARNAVGTGLASAPSNSVTPLTVPFAPTGVVATAGNAQISVAFTPGASGGSPILDFTATCGSQSTTGAGSPLVVTGLANGTAYTCTVTARNAAGTSAPSTASNSATPTVNTYSAPSATGTGTITATFTGGGPACTYTVSRFIPLSGDPASPPAGTAPAATTFPHGLFDFTASACTPGSTVTMTITYPQALLTGTQYWKYGPTPTNPAPHWYVLPATIAGNSVTFTITDGQLGDDDLAANGTIVDQGGPGVPGSATAVPTLSEWAMLLLAGLVMLAGMGAVRRRA